MPTILSADGTSFVNEVSISDSPVFRLTGNNITLTNTERGRIIASNSANPAIIVDGLGSRIVNQAGGIIRTDAQFPPIAVIRGGEGGDIVENAGSIQGIVELGNGADSYIATNVDSLFYLTVVNLGAGDDEYSMTSATNSVYFNPVADGGTGTDRLTITGPIGQVIGARLTGFEHLTIGPQATNVQEFSGFQTVTLLPAPAGGFASNNFIDSVNPLADLTLNGHYVTVGGSSVFRSVTGSNAAEGFQLATNAQILGNVSLGGGDDYFRLFRTIGNTTLGTTVDGGDGYDNFGLEIDSAAAIDLSNIINFEYLNAGTFSSFTSRATVRNASGFTRVEGDSDGVLTIEASHLPNASLFTSSLGSVTIAADTVIGRIGFPNLPGFNTTDLSIQQQGNDRLSLFFINNGTVTGAVQLYYGDDLYDGRLGATGGTIYGYAGNDRLYGGSGNDRIEGGFGADDLYGGAGDDVLDGGGGGDRMDGGAGNDRYSVDRENDAITEREGEGTDSVITTANFYLSANIENLTLAQGNDNIYGVGNDLANLIAGNGGGNLLLGGAGDDTINGGAGNDLLFGEDGIDTLNGDAGIDYIAGGAGNDIINGLADADNLHGEAGDDVLDGGAGFVTDLITGGDGNDVIRAGSGSGDYDILNGAGGNDTYYVDTPDDIIYEGAGEGIDTVYANINGAGYYLWAHVDNLVLEGNTPFGVGNALNNTLTGSAAGNYLLGDAGDDILNGKGGNDVLFGQAGADTFIFERGTGGDVIGDFARGEDRIDLRAFGLTFAQVQAGFSQVGNNSAIQLGNGDMIVLHGITMSQLTAADFIL